MDEDDRVFGQVVYVVPAFAAAVPPRKIAEMLNHGPVGLVNHIVADYDNEETGVQKGGMFVRWTQP